MKNVFNFVALAAVSLLPAFSTKAVAEGMPNMTSVSCPYDGELAMAISYSGNEYSGYTCFYSHSHLENNRFVTHKFSGPC